TCSRARSSSGSATESSPRPGATTSTSRAATCTGSITPARHAPACSSRSRRQPWRSSSKRRSSAPRTPTRRRRTTSPRSPHATPKRRPATASSSTPEPHHDRGPLDRLATPHVRGDLHRHIEKEGLVRIIVIGGAGTIGKAVVAALSDRHDVVVAGRRSGTVQVDIQSPDSVRALYRPAGSFDALVCAAGEAHFGPFETMSETELALGIHSKLLGQIRLVLLGRSLVSGGGPG